MEGCGGDIGTTDGRDRTNKGATPVSWSIWPMEEEEWHSSHPNPPQPLPISSSSCSSYSIPTTFPSYTNAFSTSPGVLNGGVGVDAHHHLTCLKLGKRQYCEEPLEGVGAKKERGMGSSSSPSSSSSSSSSSTSSSSSSSTSFMAVPRCQVEGCNVGLVEAKDYHKRHKVCEVHSKSPKVIVLGLEQRFCQQCSRFHVLSEFDDTKRSCRRRLSGHNERRRKSTNESLVRNPTLDCTMGLGGRFPFLPSTSPGCALSLLSSECPAYWVSPDLAHQSSAALRELIAENRAASFSHQLLSNHGDLGMGSLDFLPSPQPYPIPMPGQLPEEWEHLHGDNGTQVTLDLMQVPSSSYDVLPLGRSKSKEDEECCEIWKSLEETHVI